MNHNPYKPIEQLDIVFLGCGNITSKHAKLVNSIDKSASISFASRSLEKANQYVEKYSGKHAYGNYNEAIISDENNVVMVNTPPNSHFELAEAALKAGKHCIVEKPPFLQSSDFDKLGKYADDNGLQLIVSENYFYKPMRQKITSLLASEAIGKPLFIQINATKKQGSKNDWREDKSLSGFGALFEGGIHWINFINNIGFNIQTARGFVPNREQKLERSIQVTAETEKGTVINLLYSWEVDTIAGGLRISKIYGTDGSITFESNGVFALTRGKKKGISMPQLLNISGFKPMWKDFLKALKQGNSPSMSWRMAQKDLEVIEDIYNGI